MNHEHISLAQVEVGGIFRIKRITMDGVMRRRLLDLGFVPGAEVEVLSKSPLGDPVAYRVSQTTIALRCEESELILGEKVKA